jgi:hypothetical protein
MKSANSQAKPFLAIAAMKATLFNKMPSSVVIEGDTYHLSYNVSVEGEKVCTIHTVITQDIKYGIKQKIKRKLMKWLNDW